MEFEEKLVETGIPGHSSSKDWAKRIQSFLREKGISFEAEGENIRIHVDGVTVEVTEAPSGENYAVVITLPLPASSSEADEQTRGTIDAGFKLAGLLDAEELGYELDTSIPGYPSLRIVVEYKDPNKLADKLIDALEKYGVEGGSSGEAFEVEG
ncbi:hypothetical protein [Hyperthermus butylicus]|uniref:Uncharacterized protein n=1 Tax=Hyperthermus butylicus (strain DSM 5456 / JCM 9403 / PLM1-5) TaxID=415426 RepID=A2BK48_HYPBU|nr:hypothetical protein [Hyperthermus butylicus]ABM80359.1 hypothetical protein Hbut_0497 [Hyperthermus butylicus DSM 5456]